MKIEEMQSAYSAQLRLLSSQRQVLTERLRQTDGTGSFDRVELEQELSNVEKQYQETQNGMDSLQAIRTAYQNAEAARQSGEAMLNETKDLFKIMEVYRRIARGDHVPSQDEQKLMEYDGKLYMMAKSAALLAEQEGKVCESLWEDEEEDAASSASEALGDIEAAQPTADGGAQAALEETG